MSRVKFENEKDFIEVKNTRTGTIKYKCVICGSENEFDYIANQRKRHRWSNSCVKNKCSLCHTAHIFKVVETETGIDFNIVDYL